MLADDKIGEIVIKNGKFVEAIIFLFLEKKKLV